MKAWISTTIAVVMIRIHTSSMDMINFVGAFPQRCLGQAESQCKGRATFWLNSLMEAEKFIHIVIANTTFVVCQLTTCVNVLN
jgi:hypothetical protein